MMGNQACVLFMPWRGVNESMQDVRQIFF